MRVCLLLLSFFSLACISWAQTPSASGTPQPVASVSAASPELDELLQQTEKLASDIDLDLGKLKVGRWRADSASKRQAEGNIDSLQRNLTAALPQFISAVRTAPRDTAANFRLYRNLNALTDVLNSVTESAGAFGPRDQFENLNEDFNHLDSLRTAMGRRVEALADAQTLELARLRQQLHANPQSIPGKVVVDDNAPATKSKSSRKKTTQATQQQ